MNRIIPLVIAATMAAPVAGCVDEKLAPVDTTLRGTLTLELRHSATIEIVEPNDGSATRVTLTLDESFGVAPAGTELSGRGTVERFPEGDGALYTAKLSGPAQPAGPCGDQPVSLALSLHRQGENSIVHGGLSAYCGEDRWHGSPPRVLRMSGELSP